VRASTSSPCFSSPWRRFFTIANPLDEEDNRVVKVYFDVAIPLYEGTSVNDAGSTVDRAAPLQEGPLQLART
jgi:hypothetical protein